MLETSLNDLVIIATCLYVESESIDVSTIIDTSRFAALLGGNRDEEGVPDGLKGGPGVFQANRRRSDCFFGNRG